MNFHIENNRFYERDKIYLKSGRDAVPDRSISCQFKLIGKILEWLGFASKVKVDGKTCYISNRSFIDLMIQHRSESCNKASRVFRLTFTSKDYESLENAIKDIIVRNKDVDTDIALIGKQVLRSIDHIRVAKRLQEQQRKHEPLNNRTEPSGDLEDYENY